MAAPGKAQVRKRIVPQLVTSPESVRPLEEAADEPALPEPAAPGAQRDAAAWAREHLGPDRRVFVDINAAKEVDWRQVRGRAGGAAGPCGRRGFPPLVALALCRRSLVCLPSPTAAAARITSNQ